MVGYRYRYVHVRRSHSQAGGSAIEDSKLNELNSAVLKNSNTDVARRLRHLRNGALGYANRLSELGLSAFAPEEVSQLDLFHVTSRSEIHRDISHA